MINTPVPGLEEKLKRALDGVKLDHNLPKGSYNTDNTRRKYGREDGEEANNIKTSVNRAIKIGIIRAKQQQIARVSRETKNSEHIDPAVFANPDHKGDEDLNGLIDLVNCEQQKVTAEEVEESNSLLNTLKNLYDKCTSWLGRKKCCHENAAVPSPVNSAIGKAITTAATQQLGQLTPLMLRNVNIDPKFVVDPNNPNRRKREESVMI
jgi:hypothetical protein